MLTNYGRNPTRRIYIIVEPRDVEFNLRLFNPALTNASGTT
jgi:hypothetical protein